MKRTSQKNGQVNEQSLEQVTTTRRTYKWKKLVCKRLNEQSLEQMNKLTDKRLNEQTL
jgi:hypothetical protein